jgi:hypothetical protein
VWVQRVIVPLADAMHGVIRRMRDIFKGDDFDSSKHQVLRSPDPNPFYSIEEDNLDLPLRWTYYQGTRSLL